MGRNARKNLRTFTNITSVLKKAELVVKMAKPTSFSVSSRLSMAPNPIPSSSLLLLLFLSAAVSATLCPSLLSELPRIILKHPAAPTSHHHILLCSLDLLQHPHHLRSQASLLWALSASHPTVLPHRRAQKTTTMKMTWKGSHQTP